MVSTAIMKKHLLLLNRLHKQQLKNELIPTPTKLSKEEITKYFNSYFTQKDNYYIPKLTTQLKLNEEDFKAIAPKKYEKKPVEKKPVEMKKAEATKEDLPQQKEMKAKKIKLPKLEKVKAEKITLERPEMKKAEMIIMKVKKSKKEKKPVEKKNNLEIIIAEKKPQQNKTQEAEEKYFENYFKSFEPQKVKAILKEPTNYGNTYELKKAEKNLKKREKLLSQAKKKMDETDDPKKKAMYKREIEDLEFNILYDKKIVNSEKESLNRPFFDVFKEIIGASGYSENTLFNYIGSLKTINKGKYYKDFIKYLKENRNKAESEYERKNFDRLIKMIDI